MVILFLSCRNSPRPEDQTTVPNPPSSSKLLRFCLMSKVCPNNFAVPYNNKAYGPVRAVFKSETTLRSHLVRPKDAVNPAKQDGVVYRIPCECGKVYIGETGRPMQDRIKEHDRDIRFARTETSAVSEHAHNTGHKPLWNEVKFIDRDPHYYTRRVKEAIHIRLHPDNINRDSGIEIPEAWMPTIKKHNNRRAVRQRTAEGARNSEDRNVPIRAAENQSTTAEHHAL